jgi:hypothetical protein
LFQGNCCFCAFVFGVFAQAKNRPAPGVEQISPAAVRAPCQLLLLSSHSRERRGRQKPRSASALLRKTKNRPREKPVLSVVLAVVLAAVFALQPFRAQGVRKQKAGPPRFGKGLPQNLYILKPPGLTLALFWLYSGLILALFWPYSGIILALFWLPSGPIMASPWLQSRAFRTRPQT